MYAVRTQRRKSVLARDYRLTDGGNLQIERLDGVSVVFNSTEWRSVADLPTEEIETLVRAGTVSQLSEELFRQKVEDAEVVQ